MITHPYILTDKDSDTTHTPSSNLVYENIHKNHKVLFFNHYFSFVIISLLPNLSLDPSFSVPVYGLWIDTFGRPLDRRPSRGSTPPRVQDCREPTKRGERNRV